MRWVIDEMLRGTFAPIATLRIHCAFKLGSMILGVEIARTRTAMRLCTLEAGAPKSLGERIVGHGHEYGLDVLD